MLQRWLFHSYDLPNTTRTYQAYKDQVPGVGSGSKSGGIAAVDSAVALAAAANTPFDPLAVGDLLLIRDGETGDYLRKIVAKTDGANIEVGTATTLLAATTAWWFYKRDNGTGAGNGWVNARGWKTLNLCGEMVDVQDAGGCEVQVEAKSSDLADGLGRVIVAPQVYQTGGHFTIPIIPNLFGGLQSVRVGVRAVTNGTGTDDVNIWLEGERERRAS